MTAPSRAFLEHLRDLLAAVGPIEVRRMFGGAGVYAHGRMFGLIDEDTVYLKVDDESEPRFADAGSEVFRYGHKDGRVTALRYWRLPESALDDPDEAADWARLAIACAQRAAGRKKKT